MTMFVMARCIDLMRVSREPIECTSQSPAVSLSLLLDGVYLSFGDLVIDGRSVYISYGGLLMNLEGSYRKLSKLSHDNVYLLIRK
jgi:hypothetical protein